MHTLDMKHSYLLSEFKKEEEEIIPELLSIKNDLKKRLKSLGNKQIDERLKIKDEISEIETKVKILKNKQKQYYLNNSKHIFEYFEDKQTISTGSSKKNNRNVLNNFFKIKDVSNNDEIETRSNNIAKYWRNVNNEITNINDYVVPTDVCHFCHNGEFIPRDEEGIMICNNSKCGKFVHYVFDGSKPSNNMIVSRFMLTKAMHHTPSRDFDQYHPCSSGSKQRWQSGIPCFGGTAPYATAMTFANAPIAPMQTSVSSGLSFSLQ